jgi:hypothetical protein
MRPGGATPIDKTQTKIIEKLEIDTLMQEGKGDPRNKAMTNKNG